MTRPNRARLSLAKAEPPKPGTWGQLSAPVEWEELRIRTRAQSLLCGLQFRDGSSQCPPLSLSQAQDVLRYFRQPV